MDVVDALLNDKIKNKKKDNTLFFEHKKYVVRHEEYLIEIKLEEFGLINSDLYQTWSIVDDERLVLMGQEEDDAREEFLISDLKDKKFAKNEHVSIYEV